MDDHKPNTKENMSLLNNRSYLQLFLDLNIFLFSKLYYQCLFLKLKYYLEIIAVLKVCNYIWMKAGVLETSSSNILACDIKKTNCVINFILPHKFSLYCIVHAFARARTHTHTGCFTMYSTNFGNMF